MTTVGCCTCMQLTECQVQFNNNLKIKYMLIFIAKMIVSPLAITIDLFMILIAGLLWDERFLTNDNGLLIIEKVWRSKN